MFCIFWLETGSYKGASNYVRQSYTRKMSFFLDISLGQVELLLYKSNKNIYQLIQQKILHILHYNTQCPCLLLDFLQYTKDIDVNKKEVYFPPGNSLIFIYIIKIRKKNCIF